MTAATRPHLAIRQANLPTGALPTRAPDSSPPQSGHDLSWRHRVARSSLFPPPFLESMYPSAAVSYPTQVGAPIPTAYPAGADRPPSALEGLNARLGNQVNRVWELAARARMIADDVFGAGNEKGTGVTGAQPALGRYSALSSSLDSLDFAVTELWAQVDRLTCI